MIDIDAFLRDGFVKLERADLRAAADEARAALWQSIGLSPDDPSTWHQPVVWAADLTGGGPFQRLANSPALADALDAICGAGGWIPRYSLGNIPIRFPVQPGVDDRGWHIDANTPCVDGSWLVSGRPHTMLALTLLSEVGEDDAPTRIRVGSHHDAVTVFADHPEPCTAAEIAPLLDAASAERPVAYAAGSPGDVYLVHPFCLHAADEHRGTKPRFMAQAPVQLTEPLTPQSHSILGAVWRG
ncbi:phytanoyl-CoA dioxygenase family protein [Mycobacterium sp. NBC_00419]|uniref:phytanoyl-CoA dioxygenase family protein n=1 Tax=Mycobacterium sp. NBC_00419 TaxID=2975989 RepID=UPI002E1E6C42